MFRKKNTGFFTLVALFALVFCISALGSAGAKTLTDNKNGYKVDYPSDWKAKTFPKSKDLVKASLDYGGHTGVNIRVYPQKSGDFKKFTEWYVPDTIKQLESHWKAKINVLDKSFKKIGKHPGFEITMTMDQPGGKKYLLKQYLWPAPGKVHVFQCGTLYEMRSKTEPMLDGIARSFDFVK